MVFVQTEDHLLVRQAPKEFRTEVLRIDAGAEATRIAAAIRSQVLQRLRKRGAVLGISGGIDSSVTAALCVRALGPDRVVGLLMPERDCDPETEQLGHAVAEWLGISCIVEDIDSMLVAAGCYRRRDECIRRLIPEFGPDWRCKLVLGSTLERSAYNISSLVVQSPDNTVRRLRMPLDVYLGIIGATNMKQRMRMQIEYTHADRLNYAVAGTPNRLEHDLGFFVKNGDGAADLKPIAHLYKTQVYQLAEHLGVPETIRRRAPTSDTWSMRQTQDEFYFGVPYREMDLCLYGLDHALSARTVARMTGLTTAAVERVWRDIKAKRRATRYLHEPPLLVDPAS